MKLKRQTVRDTLKCPQCKAPKGQNCTGYKNRVRISNHMVRIKYAKKIIQRALTSKGYSTKNILAPKTVTLPKTPWDKKKT